MVSAVTKANQDVDITKVTPAQLAELGKAIEGEVKQLTQNYHQLNSAIGKFNESKGVLTYMQQRPENTEIMVPMTSSLYVPGKISGTNVMIEAGAGYFVEKDTKQALEYCDRKGDALKDSAAKIGNYINQKKMQMGKVQGEYNKRMIAAQQAA